MFEKRNGFELICGIHFVLWTSSFDFCEIQMHVNQTPDVKEMCCSGTNKKTLEPDLHRHPGNQPNPNLLNS